MAYYNSPSARKKQSAKRSRFHISIIFLIVLLTFLLCFIIYMISSNNEVTNVGTNNLETSISSETSVTSETTVENTETTVTTEPVKVKVNPVPESEAKDFTYFNDCVFIGDSLTVGLSSYAILPESEILADVGLNIDSVVNAKVNTANGEVLLLDQLETIKPKNIYIMLGSNGIAWLTNDHMIEKYDEFIDLVKTRSPDSTIYILSIPPVASTKETTTEGPILNSNIDIYNSNLLNLANEKDVNFVDINTALKGNDGKLPADFCGKDGMHFKKDTYSVMLDYILKHTVKE